LKSRPKIDRINQVLSEANLWGHAHRELIVALGQSRCNAAFPVLLRFASGDARRLPLVATEFVEALAALKTDDAQRALLGFIDPAIGRSSINLHFDYHDNEHLASSITELAQQQPTLKERILGLCSAHLPQANRHLLSQVIAKISSQEALLAGLNLLSDTAQPNIPPELTRGIQSVLFERRPYGSGYTLEPSNSNDIRSRLFNMVLHDAARRRAAFALLGQIEAWQLDFGRSDADSRHPDIDTATPWPPLQAVSQVPC
jgi:hypothetical protein